MTPILQVEGLDHRFGGHRALAGLSFSLIPGEILAMIGPNGAGKSTCFAALGGQLRPDAGRILLDGADITRLSPARRARLGIGRTFQTGSAFASFGAQENVQTALAAAAGTFWRPWRSARSCDIAQADALLARVGLADQAETTAGALSQPDIKRLELALALAARPRLLLMDEPTAGLAAAERAGLVGLIQHLARAAGLAVLFTEHDIDTVFAIADRVLVLDHGRLLAEGGPAEIRANQAVQAAYLGLEHNRVIND